MGGGRRDYLLYLDDDNFLADPAITAGEALPWQISEICQPCKVPSSGISQLNKILQIQSPVVGDLGDVPTYTTLDESECTKVPQLITQTMPANIILCVALLKLQ